MQVMVNVQLDEGEQFAQSAEEAAGAVLEAVGGDPDTDVCSVHLSTVTFGQAGNVAVPPERAEEPDAGPDAK